MRASRVAAAVAGAFALVVGVTTTAAAVGEQITAHVSTAKPTVGQELDITGQVTGAPSAVTVSATRDDSTAQGTPVGTPVMTDAQGNFTVKDTPPARGTVTYHLTVNDASGAATDVTTQVAGADPQLAISVGPHHADAGASVRVTAHLGAATTNRDVTLSARPYGRSLQEFDSGPVDGHGDRTADHTVLRRTTFIATFDGDSAYAPARAEVSVPVRAVIAEKLRGGYATRHGVRLYHANADVSIFLHMLPEAKGTCLVMRAQRRYSGSWHNVAVSRCSGAQSVRTNAHGEVIAQLQHPHVVGDPYRIRAEYAGSKAVGARRAQWLLLEFHH